MSIAPFSPEYLDGYANGKRVAESNARNFASGRSYTKDILLNDNATDWMSGYDLGFVAGALSTGRAKLVASTSA